MVTAATDWNEPAQRRTVRPGLAGSYEELFHAAGLRGFWLNRREVNEQSDLPPETERWSHYFHRRVTAQFDAMIHFDETSALEPLEQIAGERSDEPPET